MIDPIQDLVILASDLPAKALSRAFALGPRAALGQISGSGESRNRKQWPNEDSIALHRLPDGSFLAAVADSHFGGRAGEIIAGGLRHAFTDADADGDDADANAGAGAGEASAVTPVQRLDRALRRLDDELCAERYAAMAHRAPRDHSATTALLVHVTTTKLSFVNVGDSLLYLIGANAGGLYAELCNRPSGRFVGEQPLEDTTALAGGSYTLEPGDVILLATDGLEPEMSGLEREDVVNVIGGPDRPALERVEALLARADDPRHGGCRDNLGAVVIVIPDEPS